MPSNFGSIFEYYGTPDDIGFYNSIHDCQNALQCHLTLLELFMNVLKANSIYYRTDQFSPVGRITTEEIMNSLLIFIPEDIKEPTSQVYFEQWNQREDNGVIGLNSWYIETYENATDGAGVPPDLQAAVEKVIAVDYAIAYNEMLNEYTTKGWGGTLPIAIDGPNPQNPAITVAAVQGQMRALTVYITNYNPQLIALNTLKTDGDAPTILNRVFVAHPIAGLDVKQFSIALLNQIETSNVQRVVGMKGAIRLFLENVEANLSAGSIWVTNASLNELAAQFTGKTVNEYWRRNTGAAFVLIEQLFQIGLGFSVADGLPAVVASILTIFENFNGGTTSKPTYLFEQLTATCTNLERIVAPDRDILSAWDLEIVEPVPKTIHYADIDGLLEVVAEQFASIPLKAHVTDALVSPFPFSIYRNIQIKGDSVRFGLGNPENSSIVMVTADARETTGAIPVVTAFYRPVVGTFTKEVIPHPRTREHLTFLKFFNVSNIRDGTFYFTDPVNPTLVQTNGFKNLPDALYFDLKGLTVNGSNSTPEPIITPIGRLDTGTNYATATAAGGVSKRNFIAVVKTLSKWKSLNGQRNYDVIYETIYNMGSLNVNPHLIWYISSGELNRTDSVDDSLCLWRWLANDEIQATYNWLPAILGLPSKRQIIVSNSRRTFKGTLLTVTIDGRPFFIEDNSIFKFLEFNYNGIALYEGTAKNPAATFVETNTPIPGMPALIDAVLNREAGTSNSLAESSNEILNIFNFVYYRKTTTVADTEKVVKYLPSSYRPNSDATGIALEERGPNDEDAIGIGMPISFRYFVNTARFKELTEPKKEFGVYLKNKGNPLYRGKGKRLPAGGVMAGLRNNIDRAPKPGTNSSLSADQLSAWELDNSPEVLELWQKLKTTQRGLLPTNQEWCHLLGHGDGGDERLGNFVSGSFHCNTEQLALESKGRRMVTQSAPKGIFELRSTAYLFNDGGTLISGNYLDNDRAYQKMLKVYNQINRKPNGTRTNGAGRVLPFAGLIRYKMYGNFETDISEDAASNGTINLKLFDYLFEGQSEFMDEHQFSIIKHAAWFALAGVDDFIKWYREQSGVFAEAEMDDL